MAHLEAFSKQWTNWTNANMQWSKYAFELSEHLWCRVQNVQFCSDTKVKLKEVRALALISHPGIVKYYYSWIENDEIVSYLYIQMEVALITFFIKYLFIQLCKSTLEDWLSSNRNRELPKIKYFLAQIVSAVDYIHGLGKIHRDLKVSRQFETWFSLTFKPSNILFANENQLKVCDLGLVTDIDNNLHGNGNVGNSEDCLRTRTFGQGTPPYMAPEQVIQWIQKLCILKIVKKHRVYYSDGIYKVFE